MRRRIIPGLACLALAAVASAQPPACFRGPGPVVVPATDEITVLDPRTNSLGKPSPVLYHDSNGLQVDIPPSVIVHNFFYTGDRDFRGPTLAGGPSVIVVNHPRTGERLYLDVQMLPGSPRIIYRANSIEYDFGHQKVHISFVTPLTLGLCFDPKVTYTRSNGKMLDPHVAQRGPVTKWIDRTGAPHLVHGVVKGGASVLNASADGVHMVGKAVVSPITQVVDATPLGSIVHRDPGEQATQDRNRLLERESGNRLQENIYIPTNR